MLDMSVRAKILELMLYLKQELDLTYLYITHDLATAKFFCDRIAILYLGRIVEIGSSESIYEHPKHPYTKALLRAIPEPDPRRSVPRDLPRGEVPDAARPPLGCSFHPRCPLAFEVCGWEGRDLRDLLEARWALQEETEYEAERAIVGDLAQFESSSTTTRLRAVGKATGRSLADYLETVRSDDPDDPLWRGLRRIVVSEAHVDLEWFEPIPPRQVDVGGALVECHLFDDAALAEAERRSAEAKAGQDRTTVTDG
jgi:peptide/nickel transport system ATP-binding protein